MATAKPSPAKLPAAIWMLGFVSLLMDVSSEMIHSLLPLFMVGTLGATALIVKIFSGALSGYLGRRNGLAWPCWTMAWAPRPNRSLRWPAASAGSSRRA
jgi:hypothetical protein